MTKTITLLAGAVASLCLAATAVQPALAAIQCQGPNQVTSYGLIRTPYCEDNYLAKVAGYSPYAIRQNPNTKQEACKQVGHYPRLTGICDGYNDYGRDHVR